MLRIFGAALVAVVLAGCTGPQHVFFPTQDDRIMSKILLDIIRRLGEQVEPRLAAKDAVVAARIHHHVERLVGRLQRIDHLHGLHFTAWGRILEEVFDWECQHAPMIPNPAA